MRIVVKAVVLVALLVIWWVPWRATLAQSSPEQDRRLSALEALRIDARMTGVETWMVSIDRRMEKFENIGYGVLAILAGQLVVQGIKRK